MILIAPDKFKGTFSSAEIGRKIEEKVRREFPDAEIIRIEMADGGEGTARILAALNEMEPLTLKISNPIGERGEAECYISEDGKTAIIDSAALLGRDTLGKTDSYNPMLGSSYYLGRMIDDLAQEGIEEITIGIGGTMTVDGGAGLLQALGFRFLDSRGDELPAPITPNDLGVIRKVIPAVSPLRIRALADVAVPLLPSNPEGMSALSFAPQKGITSAQLGSLEAGLRNFQDQMEALCLAPYLHRELKRSHIGESSGAGGGLAMGLRALGAEMIGGARYILDRQLKHNGVDINAVTHVYTGEGCLDMQSFCGKVTGTIAELFARERQIPVTIICGRVDLLTDYHLSAGVAQALVSDFL